MAQRNGARMRMTCAPRGRLEARQDPGARSIWNEVSIGRARTDVQESGT